jgi:alkyl sulfatase-like protein
VQVQSGEPASPDASLRTDPRTLNALLDDPGGLDAAVSDGSATVTGDRSALRRLLALREPAAKDSSARTHAVLP